MKYSVEIILYDLTKILYVVHFKIEMMANGLMKRLNNDIKQLFDIFLNVLFSIVVLLKVSISKNNVHHYIISKD